MLEKEKVVVVRMFVGTHSYFYIIKDTEKEKTENKVINDYLLKHQDFIKVTTTEQQ